MSAVVKTRHIRQANRGSPYLLSFKRATPRRIIADAHKRYARYLSDASDKEFIPIAETSWYKQMSREMTPARYLKTYREIAGHSQARLGELVGTPATRISDYETGQRAISKEMAKKLAEVFKASPAVFI
jgi:DNA-binding XRE family transcriptional regulator